MDELGSHDFCNFLKNKSGQFGDEVAVGTVIADRPPRGSARALISACGSYRR
jgi:hypothetical protein